MLNSMQILPVNDIVQIMQAPPAEKRKAFDDTDDVNANEPHQKKKKSSSKIPSKKISTRSDPKGSTEAAIEQLPMDTTV